MDCYPERIFTEKQKKYMIKEWFICVFNILYISCFLKFSNSTANWITLFAFITPFSRLEKNIVWTSPNLHFKGYNDMYRSVIGAITDPRQTNPRHDKP